MKIIGLFTILVCAYFSHSAPVPKELVDLTHFFDNDTLHHPIHRKFEIKVAINASFQDVWVLTEEYNSGTHAGTHVDAPCHIVLGKWTLDQIPLDRFIAPAAVIDIERQCELDHEYQMTVDDLMDWETRTGQVLNDVIIFVRTGWGKRWGDPKSFYGINDMETEFNTESLHFPGISGEAAEWLVNNRNIFGLGIDTLSLDSGASQSLAAHKALLGNNIYGMENVANLDKVPLFGAKVFVMPMNIKGSSGAPVRIMATYPRVVFA